MVLIAAPPSSNILLNVEYSLTSCANGGGNGPGNEGSGDEGSGENTEDGTGSLISETMTTVTEYKDKEGPYIQDTEHIRTVAPIVLSPPIDFNTPTTTPAPGSTAGLYVLYSVHCSVDNINIIYFHLFSLSTVCCESLTTSVRP